MKIMTKTHKECMECSLKMLRGRFIVFNVYIKVKVLNSIAQTFTLKYLKKKGKININ